VTLFGSTVAGSVALVDNHTPRAILLAGNTFRGAVTCSGNGSRPEDGGSPNAFTRGAAADCSGR
jgi:hypothetical protein